MSKLFSKFLGFFSSRTLVGVDKVGNRYFARVEEIDGISKGGSPDLRSFIRQFPDASFAPKKDDVSDGKDVAKKEERSTEPTGSGKTFKPGAWQPPSS
ncbi:hypothetical protein C4D60_Mb08t06600 [Musa balbisiana]|uniref:Uncharacterized protein n=1 Tax=Musa balbisiana TaxID=52838 RepID=A0A4S8K1X4_MUSBA|nr:hypothetical protein C4D60_Mb08t06600 [Musa balbisiana]